jgi:hypothetical protein
VIDAEGEAASLDALGARIADAPPLQARVEAVEAAAAVPRGCRGFAIDRSDAERPLPRGSRPTSRPATPVSSSSSTRPTAATATRS